MPDLLTRGDFRRHVSDRDNGKCVICKKPAVDAYHIMDRKLWPDGGYYTDNGVSLCAEHHLACEKSEILPDELRRVAGICVMLPPGLDPDFIYDKWGEPIGVVEDAQV